MPIASSTVPIHPDRTRLKLVMTWSSSYLTRPVLTKLWQTFMKVIGWPASVMTLTAPFVVLRNLQLHLLGDDGGEKWVHPSRDFELISRPGVALFTSIWLCASS